VHGEEAIDTLTAAGVPTLTMELGDPGIVHDAATPRSSLPNYEGPPAQDRGNLAGMAPEPTEETR